MTVGNNLFLKCTLVLSFKIRPGAKMDEEVAADGEGPVDTVDDVNEIEVDELLVRNTMLDGEIEQCCIHLFRSPFIHQSPLLLQIPRY